MTDDTFLSWIDRGELLAALIVALGVSMEFVLQWSARSAKSRVEFKRQTELAEQRERTAVAERQVLEVRKRQEPRHLDADAFVRTLEGKSRGTALITYDPDNNEAFALGLQLLAALNRSGWRVAFPEPVSVLNFPQDVQAMLKKHPEAGRLAPLTVLAGGGTGVAIAASSLQEPPNDEPLIAVLSDAFTASGLLINGKRADEALPRGTVRIIVGPKP